MKEVFVEREKDLIRVAIKEDHILKHCYFEESNDLCLGQIYKGTVKNIVPAIKSAFIDIGFYKNCYMYIDKKFNNSKIRKGDEVIVEVLKEGIGSKGPKVTNAFTIPGRYCVLLTLNKDVTFSQKIKDEAFIATVLQEIRKPEEFGIMIRTNAQNTTLEEINKEIENLTSIYNGIQNKAKYSMENEILLDTGGVIGKILRDNLDVKTSEVFVNDEKDYSYINEYISMRDELEVKVTYFKENINLFDYFGIEKEIMRLRTNRIELPCGGFIVIDKTEAMHVIDVNSGKNVSNNSMQDTALKTNMEAAKEISRQIILRNLSGIIVIDFIDVYDKFGKEKILDLLKAGFEKDSTKTIIFPMTELNLIQISRARKGKTIDEFIEDDCTECEGKGRKIKYSYLLHLIKNEILKMDKGNQVDAIIINIDKYYEKFILKEVNKFAKEIQAQNKTIYIKWEEKYEYFKVEQVIFAEQKKNIEKYKVYG